MQHQIATIAAEIEAVRTLVYNCSRRQMAGLPFTKQAAITKYLASEVPSAQYTVIWGIT
jgi:alkylation response protein AidB-like acyl-CoA dehydrogenase